MKYETHCILFKLFVNHLFQFDLSKTFTVAHRHVDNPKTRHLTGCAGYPRLNLILLVAENSLRHEKRLNLRHPAATPSLVLHWPKKIQSTRLSEDFPAKVSRQGIQKPLETPCSSERRDPNPPLSADLYRSESLWRSPNSLSTSKGGSKDCSCHSRVVKKLNR